MVRLNVLKMGCSFLLQRHFVGGQGGLFDKILAHGSFIIQHKSPPALHLDQYDLHDSSPPCTTHYTHGHTLSLSFSFSHRHTHTCKHTQEMNSRLWQHTQQPVCLRCQQLNAKGLFNMLRSISVS